MHYHDYEVISESIDGVVERCNECGKRLVTKKGNKGIINNAAYLKEHIRHTAQPDGVTGQIFKRFYDKKRT